MSNLIGCSTVALPLHTGGCSIYNYDISTTYKNNRATLVGVWGRVTTTRCTFKSLASRLLYPPLKRRSLNHFNGIYLEQPRSTKVAHPPHLERSGTETAPQKRAGGTDAQ